jgi:hypothetical protein
MTKRLIGLDGEMSDSELADGAVLIQIGVAFDATERFSALLGWPDGSYFKTDRAMAVHGIDPVAIAEADPPAEVDAQLEAWLLARGADSEKRALVPVGYNVGAFDLPFVAAYLPRTSQLLSRRPTAAALFLSIECPLLPSSHGRDNGLADLSRRTDARAKDRGAPGPRRALPRRNRWTVRPRPSGGGAKAERTPLRGGAL